MEDQFLQLKESLLKTIVFYDMFDCPLTAYEVWTYCDARCSLGQALAAMDCLAQVKRKGGFYFLRGREEIVALRLANRAHARRKFRRAILVARLFKFIPWIRMIAIGNQMGADNLRDESDIDFFIITDVNRIWITRWFCAGLAKILKLRPKPDKRRDTICLSFYISAERLDASGLMLAHDKCHDIYFVQWLANLAVIYDRGSAYREFMLANSWISEFLPNWAPSQPVPARDAGPGFSDFYRDIVDMLIGGADQIVKRIQLRIMPEVLHCAMNIDTRTVVNDKILKLYINDRREEYRERYLRRLGDFI